MGDMRREQDSVVRQALEEIQRAARATEDLKAKYDNGGAGEKG